MQIVINLSNEVMERLANGNEDMDDAAEIIESIAQGIILPEHHGRLIDADNLHTVLDYHMHNIDGIHEIIDTDEDIKTIIEADKGE